jgi:hypothetical protein
VCVWCPRVAKVVEPKRQKLREAETQLEQANAQLQEKQDALAAVVANVNSLKKQLADAQSEQCKLNDQVSCAVGCKRTKMAPPLCHHAAYSGGECMLSNVYQFLKKPRGPSLLLKLADNGTQLVTL